MSKVCNFCKYYEQSMCMRTYDSKRKSAETVAPNWSCEYHEWSNDAVRQSVEILRDELLQYGDLYDAFLASIKSGVDDYVREYFCYNVDRDSIAERILIRIIGEG